MNKYIAIGHFKKDTGLETYTRSVVMENSTLKAFHQDLRGNGFVAYVTFTEKYWNRIKNLDGSFELYETVKKLTANYRVWNEVTEYLGQCSDIIENHLAQ